jgi:glycosyltransferase involved in cell wall biosynthesis
MHVLIITNNPDRASFRQRVEIYLDYLRAEGMNCTVRRFPTGPLARWRLLKSSRDFDAVFLHKKRLNPFDAFLLRRYARKVIYDFDDAVMYDDNCPDKPSPKRLRDFRRTVELADLVIAGNKYLAELARPFNNNVELLPTGLNIGEYDVKTTRPNDGKIRLVWIGGRATLPYLKEIKPALEEIGARFDNVILRIISDEFFDLESMQVDKRRWSQQTEVADLITSDIGLAPLPDNPFTRGKCGFKILQYAAAGLPTVASPVGVNAELVRDGFNGYHAITIKDWVEKVASLAHNESIRGQMGQAAGQMVRSLDSDAIGRRLIALVRDTIVNTEMGRRVD